MKYLDGVHVKNFILVNFYTLLLLLPFILKKHLYFGNCKKNNYKIRKLIIKIRVFIQNINIIYLINMLSSKYDI